MKSEFATLYKKYEPFTSSHSSTINCCLSDVDSRFELLQLLGIKYLMPNGIEATLYLNKLKEEILKNKEF